MQITKEWLEYSGISLTEHLNSRFMSGSPYINVLGPIAPDQFDYDEIDDDWVTGFELNNYSNDAQWKFTPNKAEYNMKISPYNDSSFYTIISFYIRIDEGCERDLHYGNDVPIGKISESDLNSSFKRIELSIESSKSFSTPKCTLKEDGNEKTINFNNDIKEDLQVITLYYQSVSNYFMGYNELIKQNYLIRIQKQIKKIDENYLIRVTLENLSPKIICREFQR